MSAMSPDLLSLLFSGGKMPWEDDKQGGAAAPGLMMPPQPNPAQPQPPKPSPVSDDPSVTAAAVPPIPTAPTLRGPNTDLQAKLTAARAPLDENQYKPKWYDYLAGGLAGFGAGFGSRNPQLGGQIAGDVVDRRLIGAREDQTRNVDSLTKQLEQEEKSNKEYNTSQESEFNNKMAVAKEGRERQTATNTAGYHQDILDLRQSVAADKLDQAQKQLAAMEERSKSDAGYRMQMLQQKQELIDLKEKMSGQGKPASKDQSLRVQNKRDTAWDRAHRDYAKATTMLGPKDTKGRDQAREDYYDARQKAQDDYENDIGVLGGGAEHVDLPRNHFGEQGATPAAQPAATAPSTAPAAATPKAVGKSVVQDYAKSHKLTYQQAEQGFKSKGYTVQ